MDVFHQGVSHNEIPLGWVIEIPSGSCCCCCGYHCTSETGVGTILNALEIGLVVNIIGDRLPSTESADSPTSSGRSW